MRAVYAVHRQFELLDEKPLKALYRIVDQLEPQDRGAVTGFAYEGSPTKTRRLLSDLYLQLKNIDNEHRLLPQLAGRTCLIVELDTPQLHHLHFPFFERKQLWFPVRRTIEMTSDYRQTFRPLERGR